MARRLAKGKGNCAAKRAIRGPDTVRQGYVAPGFVVEPGKHGCGLGLFFSRSGCVQATLKYRVLMCGNEKTEEGCVEP